MSQINILETGLASAWKKIVKFTASLKPDKDYQCFSCELNKFCSWCPAMAWRYKGKASACIPEYKELAQIKKEVFYAAA